MLYIVAYGIFPQGSDKSAFLIQGVVCQQVILWGFHSPFASTSGFLTQNSQIFVRSGKQSSGCVVGLAPNIWMFGNIWKSDWCF